MYQILSTFGSGFSKIEVNLEHIGSNDHEELVKKVNELLLESLVELNIYGCAGNLLKRLVNPFKRGKRSFVWKI